MTVLARTGQFGVVRTKGFIPMMIRLFTRSQVNHAYIYVSENTILEAKGRGAVLSAASKYEGHERAESDFAFTVDQRHDLRQAAMLLRGTPYNFLDILVLFLMSFGLRWGWLIDRAQNDHTLICSQLVDRAYTGAWFHLFSDERPDGQVTPGDLLMRLAQKGSML